MTRPRPALPRRLQRLFPPLAFAAALTAFFWPLLLHLGSALHDRSDTMLNTWIINWQAHILPRAPGALFDAPIFYPLHNTLALSEIIWPQTPAAVPLLAASNNPVLVYNLVWLGVLLLAAGGMYLLALDLTGSRGAAVFAGLLYAFSPHMMSHVSQIQLLTIGWLPLVLLSAERVWTRGRSRDGVLFAFFVAAQTLSSFYYGFQVVLVVGLYLLVRLLTRPTRDGLRRLLRFVPWGALAVLAVLPFAVPYVQVRASLGLERSLIENIQAAPSLADFIRPSPGHPLTRLLSGPPPWNAGWVFPGLVPLTLGIAGLFAWRQRSRGQVTRWLWPVLGLTALILALGPSLKLTPDDPGRFLLPFGWLLQHVPGVSAIRAPDRFMATFFLVLALAAAQALRWLTARVRMPALRAAVWLLLTAVCLGETAGGRGVFAMQPVPSLNPAPPLYAWLAEQPAAAIVEFPLTSEMPVPPQGPMGVGPAEAWPDYNSMRYQYLSMADWKPRLDGYSGFRPPHHRELGLTLADFPTPRGLALLRGLDAQLLVIHSALMEAYQPGRAAAMAAALAQADGVTHVRDFGPDWVYRVDPRPAEPVQAAFWSTEGGDAFLLLHSAGSAAAVLRPDQLLTVRGEWRSGDAAPGLPFELQVRLPLLVGEGSSVALGVPRPPRAGPYRLTLQAASGPLSVAAYERDVAVALPGRAVTLFPARSLAPAKSLHVEPGATVSLALPWRLTDRPPYDASVSLQLVDATQHAIANDDHPLGGERDIVVGWQPGLVVTTTHTLHIPANLLGRFTLRAFIYRPGSDAAHLLLDADGRPVDALSWPLSIKPAGLQTLPLPPAAPLARFGAAIYLVSAEAVPPAQAGDPFRATLVWTVGEAVSTDYTRFVHLVDEAGSIVAQSDAPPGGPTYGMTGWDPGEVITDVVTLTLPPARGGQSLCLRVGLYDPATLQRLPRADAAGDLWQSDRCWRAP